MLGYSIHLPYTSIMYFCLLTVEDKHFAINTDGFVLQSDKVLSLKSC